jgi:bifunctional non-homologous end joining protein LigD
MTAEPRAGGCGVLIFAWVLSCPGRLCYSTPRGRVPNSRPMLLRTPTSFIGPCLPSSAEGPPTGPEWVHEIKHDGYRLMARRDPIGIRLLTRNGHDWSPRYPLIVEAVNRLKGAHVWWTARLSPGTTMGSRSFNGCGASPRASTSSCLPSTCSNSTARTYGGSHSRHARQRLPACFADVCRGCASTSTCRIQATSCSGTPAKMGLEGIVSKRLGSPYRSGRSKDWLKMKSPDAPAVRREAEEDWGTRRR